MYLLHRVGRVLSFFSSRRNWDSPTPSPAGEWGLPRFWGEGHTRWRERGWESPNSDEGTYTVELLIYTYFVICLLCYFPTFFAVREGERGELQGLQVVQGDVHHAKQKGLC